MISPTFLQTASRVLSAAFRMAFLTLANIISMGFGSGEYGGGKSKCVPASRMARGGPGNWDVVLSCCHL